MSARKPNPEVGGAVAVTQAQIAWRLGISQITVSRVLNNSPLVTEETRARILAEIGKAGYALNRNARNLAAKRTGTLAVVFPDPGSMGSIYFLSSLMGISEAVNERHLLMQILSTERGMKPAEVVDAARGQVDGFIVFNLVHRRGFARGMSERLRELAIPHVLIQSDKEGDSPHVTIDNRAGGRKAVAHLLELGHTRLGYIGPSGGDSHENRERREGLLEVCGEVGVTVESRWLVTATSETMASLLKEWMKSSASKRPTAFFTYSDHLARLMAFACQAEGLQVPGDLSLVGFDDLMAYSLMASPYLTTVRQPFKELGREAVKLVLDGEVAPVGSASMRRLIVPELVVRSSTGAPG